LKRLYIFAPYENNEMDMMVTDRLIWNYLLVRHLSDGIQDLGAMGGFE